MKPLSIILCLLLCLSLLAGCSGSRSMPEIETTEAPETTEEITEATEDPKISVENLSTVVTEKTIHTLDEYPNLKEVDLCGSTCYTAIMVYIQNHPDIRVTYNVDFGGAAGDNWTTDLELPAEGVNFEDLLHNLIYLPQVESVHLPMTNLTLENMETLKGAYPEIAFTYTVNVLGRELDLESDYVDLSGMTSGQIESAVPALMLLPNLANVELMDDSGSCSLSRQDVKRLVDVAPGVNFHYVFSLFGQTISTTDEKVRFDKLSLTADDEPAIREALSIMTGCKTFVLNRCGLSNELMASIRADYPNTELVWDCYFGKDGRYGGFTNTDTIRAVYNVTDDTCYNLRYFQDVKYIDMGHNDTLTDVSWAEFMPQLEILILSGAPVTDLTGLGYCKNLEWLELANCYKLSDLTPLSGCSGLKYLNICFSKVSDLMPLDGLPLELLFCKQTRVNAEEQKIFKEVHEDCIATFYGKDPYAGPGWRYTDNGHTFTEPYKKVREVFKLDEVDKRLKAQEDAQKK